MCHLSLLAFAEYTKSIFSSENNNSILFELIRMSDFNDANPIHTDAADAISLMMIIFFILHEIHFVKRE